MARSGHGDDQGLLSLPSLQVTILAKRRAMGAERRPVRSTPCFPDAPVPEETAVRGGTRSSCGREGYRSGNVAVALSPLPEAVATVVCRPSASGICLELALPRTCAALRRETPAQTGLRFIRALVRLARRQLVFRDFASQPVTAAAESFSRCADPVSAGTGDDVESARHRLRRDSSSHPLSLTLSSLSLRVRPLLESLTAGGPAALLAACLFDNSSALKRK